jgi:adenylate cyclase
MALARIGCIQIVPKELPKGVPQLLIRKHFLAGLAIAFSIGVVFCLAFCLNLLYGLQQRSGDFLFRAADLYQETEPQERIIIVGIDNKSLAQLGHFPLWSRSHYAQLIGTLSEAKARVVVFDILFSEPTSGDEELATAIRNAGNVILPTIYTPTTLSSALNQQTAESRSLIKPLEIFQAGAAAFGYANVTPDADGIMRQLSIAIGDGDGYEPALALAAVAEYLRRPEVIESPIKDNVLPFAGRLIPLIDSNEMLINYISSPQRNGGIVNFETVSFVDVINGEVAPTLFQDKIVIIGATASGLGDTFWTPMGRMMHGVEVHASAIHTILSGNFLKPAPSIVTIASMLVMAPLCGLAVLRLRVLWASLSAVFLCFAYFLVAFFLFDNGVVLNMLYPPLTILGAFVGLNVYNVTAERSEKRKIAKTFGRYISPQVADRILAALDEGKLKLGGEVHEVTVAFADVRGFTSISEKMQPEELVRVLNTYLSLVIKAVLKYEGMINKFGGDSITAIWNVPTECEGHSLLAIKAALEAQRSIKELQKEATLPKMDFGIGINTGKAVAGNMGSEDRLEYSVIGDAVNVAARLASTAPGGKVWIGANTFELVKDYIKAKPLRPLAMKGKRKPVTAYEVVGVKSW